MAENNMATYVLALLPHRTHPVSHRAVAHRTGNRPPPVDDFPLVCLVFLLHRVQSYQLQSLSGHTGILGNVLERVQGNKVSFQRKMGKGG
jgi:hypothetical protein